MPVEALEDLEGVLREREILYTRHFEDDVLPDRPNITKSLVEGHLRNKTGKIADWRHQPDDKRGTKYSIIYDKSNKYWLKIVVSDYDQFIKVVTAHLINKEKKNAVEDML